MLDIGSHTLYYLTKGSFSVAYSLCNGHNRVYALDSKLLQSISQQYELKPLSKYVVKHLFSNNARVISTINIELVDYCNLQCIHCYANMDAHKRLFLSQSSFDNIINEIKEIDTSVNIKVSGGEPSLHPDIVDICQAIQTIKPIEAHKLLTNLTMSENTLLNIIKTGISLQISIYGCSFNDFHRFTRGSQKQYDVILNNLKTISSKYINNSHIVFHVPQYTKESMRSCELFADTFGISYHVGGINYIGRAYLNNELLEAKTSLNSDAYTKTLLCNRICENSKICILTNGDITPCPFFRAENKDFVIGNINRQRLRDILQSQKLQRFDDLSIDDVEGCKECPLKYVCSGGCSAERLTMTGSILKKYPRCSIENDIDKLDKNYIYEVAMVKPGYFKFIKRSF